MTGEPAIEQLQKFWEKCGFELIPYQSDGYMKLCDEHWHYPDGKDRWVTPDIDLNNLFLYAMPIIFHRDVINRFECMVDSRRDGLGYQWVIESSYVTTRTYRTGEYITDNALALFWAIYKALGVE